MYILHGEIDAVHLLVNGDNAGLCRGKTHRVSCRGPARSLLHLIVLLGKETFSRTPHYVERISVTSSRPIEWDGLPLITERLSCFAEACPVELSPFQVLQPLHRQQPQALRPKCSWQH
jgi:hypothetical protein